MEAIVAGRREEVIAQAYADGYGRTPESERETVEAKRLAEGAIGDEPWEKWW